MKDIIISLLTLVNLLVLLAVANDIPKKIKREIEQFMLRNWTKKINKAIENRAKIEYEKIKYGEELEEKSKKGENNV